MSLRIFGAAAMAATAIFAPVVSAQAIIPPDIYRLCNHPDGNAADPLYGLRLDELFDVTPDDDIFTFDFDHPLSDMILQYTGDQIIISGEVFGGHDIGDQYDPASPLTGVYTVNFVYDVGLQVATPDDDLIVAGAPTASNTGSILSPTGVTIDLFDKPLDGFSFRLGNTDDDMGFRDFDGISGWGWLNHAGRDTHIESSDWLFTLKPIPTPATIAITGVGLAFATARRRARAIA